MKVVINRCFGGFGLSAAAYGTGLRLTRLQPSTWCSSPSLTWTSPMPKRKVKAATRHARAKREGLRVWGGYEAQLERQEGGCAICGQPPGSRRLHVDHNHLTGACRGLLCWTCNATIGRAHENMDRLRLAAAYLRFGWAVTLAWRQAERAMRLKDAP